MAISKVIYKSSPSATGVTWMDVTGKTVTSASMRNGVTALKNDGTDITGNIADMTLPSSASASSSGTSKATITPTSSAQYLNIPTGYNDVAQYYTIAAASGGASNIVTGTFKGTTTGAAMDVTLNYSGSGYPIAVLIYPTEGPYNNTTGSFYNLIQRYAIATYYCVKSATDSTPTYPSGSTTDRANQVVYLYRYKSSTTNADTTANYGSATYNYRDIDAASGQSTILRIRSKTKMSVFIAGTSYGFAANVDYTYHVIYSS